MPCVVQPRDVALLRDVRRYKFLTAPQLRELWWAKSSVQAADRRLLKLFRAGYLEQGVLRVGGYWSAERLRDPRARLVRPDAVLEVAEPDGDSSRVLFLEYDRTRRVDKNY